MSDRASPAGQTVRTVAEEIDAPVGPVPLGLDERIDMKRVQGLREVPDPPPHAYEAGGDWANQCKRCSEHTSHRAHKGLRHA